MIGLKIKKNSLNNMSYTVCLIVYVQNKKVFFCFKHKADNI